jgi:hypothetical protein
MRSKVVIILQVAVITWIMLLKENEFVYVLMVTLVMDLDKMAAKQWIHAPSTMEIATIMQHAWHR